MSERLKNSGASDSDDSLGKIVMMLNGFMDSPGLTQEIQVKGANKDAFVIWSCIMQANEMPAIECQNGSAVRICKIQNRFIWECEILSSSFEKREYIMSQSAQLFYNGEREVLIRSETRHVQAAS